MARGKKNRFRASTEARRRARLGAGTPPSVRVIPHRRDKPVKHKKGLKELLEEP